MDSIMKAYLESIKEEAPAIEAEWAELQSTVEWHCPGRHGVIRNVPADKAGRVQQVVEWYFGHKACRWTDTVNGTRNVEFVAMTKTVPAPSKPWEWCGTTVLFEDWQRQEEATRDAIGAFEPGEAVWFMFDGQRKEGIIGRLNVKTIGVTVAGEGGYRVPPHELHKVGA